VTSQWLHAGDVLEFETTRMTVEEDGQQILIRVSEAVADTVSDRPGPEPPPADLPQGRGTIKVSRVAYTPPPAHRPTRRRWRPSLGVIAEASVLIALAAVMWFVFTARSVTIIIEPGPDRIAVSGGLPSPRIGERFLLRPGRYTVRAEREGYRELNRPIEITRESGQEFYFDLELLPGRLDVSTGDVEGARVFIDDEPVGSTPLEGHELAPGEHVVEIRAERYRAHSGTIEIPGPGSRVSYEAELVPAWATVTVRSRPAGASVTVDGRQAGTTPLVTEMVEGSHSIELLLAGYKPVRRRLRVVAQQDFDTGVITMQAAEGNLSLTSEPTEATVVVDGEYIGSTPLDLELSPGQIHEIELSRAGYESHVAELSLAAGDQNALRVVLTPQYGQVTVSSRPPNAEIFVDGESRGLTTQTLDLTAEPHEIEVRLSGHEVFRTSVVPSPGLAQSVEATLQTLDERARIPASIESPQGVEMVLIPPGRFTMGASRRVPGRRANESLREVELTRPFYLAIREVSNREFREFEKRHLSGGAGSHSLEIDHHPVVRVTWEQAARYCNWLSQKEGLPPVYVERSGRLAPRSPLPAGYRLPTEAEWAWAARVPDGSNALKYAWGNTLPIDPGSDNYGDRSAQALLGGSLPSYDDSYPVTAPVGSFEANPRGLFNMGGNVSEWVHDIYTIYTPARGDIASDPTGPDEGEYHVIRGASWMDESVTELRLSYRDYGADPRPDVGFRIARSAVIPDREQGETR
jgi:formylglycine-generating enzyme required for sulfatase activity